MNERTPTWISGSCLCSSVQFCVGGEFGEMNHCHCSMCRKYHGAAFATYLHVSKLQWLSGSGLVTDIESSPGAQRSFCSRCGSVLPMHSIDGRGYDVPAGPLDQDPNIRPNKHIFAESRAPWFDPGDELPQQNGYGPGSTLQEVDRPDRSYQAGVGYCGGSCACGRINFRYQKKTTDFLMYCHCSRCRKVKGAAHATNIFVQPEQFEWISGTEWLASYDHTNAQRFGNNFCKKCGSSIPRQASNSPSVNIPAGSLDDNPGLAPKAHIHVDSKAPWYDVPRTAVHYSTMPTDKA